MGRPVKKHLDSILERQEARRAQRAENQIMMLAEKALAESYRVLEVGGAISKREDAEALLDDFGALEMRYDEKLTKAAAVAKVLKSRDGQRLYRLIRAGAVLDQTSPVTIAKATKRQSDAERELEDMARLERARNPKLTHAQSMDRVLRTDEGRALQEKVTQNLREASAAGMPMSGWKDGEEPTDAELGRLLTKRAEFETLARQVIAPNLDVSARQQILKRMQELDAE